MESHCGCHEPSSEARRAVLVVPACELHVVQDDPVVGGEQLGQRYQRGEEVGLVDGAHLAVRQVRA